MWTTSRKSPIWNQFKGRFGISPWNHIFFLINVIRLSKYVNFQPNVWIRISSQNILWTACARLLLYFSWLYFNLLSYFRRSVHHELPHARKVYVNICNCNGSIGYPVPLTVYIGMNFLKTLVIIIQIRWMKTMYLISSKKIKS